MESPRPELAIVLALVGVLIAVGVPALQRGQLFVGWACLTVAAAVALWGVIEIRRTRR